MFALDLFNTVYERALNEGAVDDLEARHIHGLNTKMLDLLNRAHEAKDPAHKAGLKREYEKIKAERDEFFKIKAECMGYGTLVGEAGLPDIADKQAKMARLNQPGRAGTDAVTPQQRVAGATPAKTGAVVAAKDVAGGLKRWLKGEPDQGPTYEDKDQKKKFKSADTSNELRKIRAKYPAAGSDAEAILKRDLDTDQEQDNAIQSLSVVTKDLETELDNLKQTKPAVSLTPTAVPGVAPVPSMPAISAGPAPSTTTPTPGAPAVTMPAMGEPAPAVAAEPDRAVTPVTAKTAKAKPAAKAKRTAKFVPQPVKTAGDRQATTKLQMPTKASASTADNVVDIRSRLSGAGLPGAEPLRRAAESVNEEQASPAIDQMVQTLTAPNIEKDNIKAFRDAYEATKGCKLNFGGSANISLSFTTMDAIVSLLTAYPPEKQKEIWHNLFTNATYLTDFLKDNVPQRGLIEADVIPLAQQRQAPDQLKAYTRALEILSAAKNPNIPDERVNMLKQALFKDFGTRIQRAPDGHYYITLQGKQIKLPEPTGGYVEETKPSTIVDRSVAALKAMPKIDFKLAQHQKQRKELERLRARLDAELAQKDQQDQEYWRTHAPRATRLKDPSAKLENQNLNSHAIYIDNTLWKVFADATLARKEAQKVIDSLKHQGRDQKVTVKPYVQGVTSEGYQDFNKVEPYEVCLAGKPVKTFDYYEDARRFHDNWKKKLYREGNKEKADKITLNPVMKEATNRHFGPKGAGTELARQIRANNNTNWTKDLSKDQLDALAGPRYPKRPKIQVKKNKGVAEANANDVNFGHTVTPGGWIVYDPETKQIKKRFKTHTAGKSYAQTHNLGFASSEYYFDRVKEKAVAESRYTFSNGDQVELKPEYADRPGEIYTVSQCDTERGRCWIGDEQDRGWYVKFDQIIPAQELNEESSTSSEDAESAILKRIMVAHLDLLKEFGPEKVMQAVEEVAYGVGDLDEIGSSDVSAWVHQVKDILGVPEELDEKWSQTYKKSINCSNPKGFSQKAHCAGRKKK